MYPGLFRTAHDERGWSCATVSMRPRWLWWWVVDGAGCDRLAMAVRVWTTNAKGPRPIGGPNSCWWCACAHVPRARVLCHLYIGGRGPHGPQVDRYHVGCHVMLAAARGESLSDPRKERVRFEPGPRFWGTYSPGPLSTVLRLRNPLARPQLSFYHGSVIGVWDTSMPRSCTVSLRQI